MNELADAGDWPGVVALEKDAVAVAAGFRSSQPKNAGVVYNILGSAFYAQGEYGKAIEYHQKCLAIVVAIGERAVEGKAYANLGLVWYAQEEYGKAIEYHQKALEIAVAIGDRAGEGKAYGDLGSAFHAQGEYGKAIEYHQKRLEIAVAIGDRAGEGAACSNLGAALEEQSYLPAAARALALGLAALQRVERDMGAHDDRRVSLFEQQQITYMILQSVLLGLGQEEWALGVAAQAKARALTHRLGARISRHDAEASASDSGHEEACRGWWEEVQEHARSEGAALRIVEYFFLFDDRLAIWVLSGEGELLLSTTQELKSKRGEDEDEDEGSTGRSIRKLLGDARRSMKVRGRDAMASGCNGLEHGGADAAQASLGESASMQGRADKCRECGRKFNECACEVAKTKVSAGEEVACEGEMLRELHQVLVEPVEGALEGAKEVLIVPHKELFEVR